MLTELEKHEILEETKLYPYPQAVCLDALKIVQRYRGWVNDDSICDIAGILGMSVEEVDGVATFYSRIYRKPVGRHVILLCDSISCMIMGYGSIYDYLSTKLGLNFGDTTPDGRFTLLPISCLGNCDFAPSMMIDNDLYNKLNIENIDTLLENYV
jgi:NADH-quinone oxidoreductase subunit E